MRALLFTLILILIPAAACNSSKRAATPVETLKAYSIALKGKDTTMMKLLLSQETLKLHQEEAKARGGTLDEIVSQQSLFPADQKFFNYRNEKIEGDKATVEVENAFGEWDRVYLVKEDGAWKIDQKSTADQMIQSVEERNKKLDQMIDEGKPQATESPSPEATSTLTQSATPSPAATPATVPSVKPSIPAQTPPQPAN